jgi:hypothetical protein
LEPLLIQAYDLHVVTQLGPDPDCSESSALRSYRFRLLVVWEPGLEALGRRWQSGSHPGHRGPGRFWTAPDSYRQARPDRALSAALGRRPGMDRTAASTAGWSLLQLYGLDRNAPRARLSCMGGAFLGEPAGAPRGRRRYRAHPRRGQ